MDAEHDDAEEPLARFEIRDSSIPPKKWALLLFADRLQLESADGASREIAWAERHERVQLHDRVMLRRVLIAKPKKKKIIFRLEPEAFAALKAWYGPLTNEDLKVSLKRRFSWVLPVGVLYVVTSIPNGAMPLEPVGLGLGTALILTGLLAKLWPHRVFFAFESLWFCLLAANSIAMLVEDWNLWQVAMLVLQMILAFRCIQEFHRFAPERMASTEDDGLELA